MNPADPVDAVDPYSVVTLDDVRTAMQRESSGDDWLLVNAINATRAVMEMQTRRKLMERIWATPTTIACTTTVDSVDVTGGSGFTSLVGGVGLDALGASLSFGSRVALIQSATALKLDRRAKVGGATSITFGRGHYGFRHDGGEQVLLPQFPATTVYSLKVLGSSGDLTTIDLANAILDEAAGILQLTSGSIARDDWCQAEFKAGMRPPSNTDIGHDEFSRVQQIAHRLVQVLFSDYKHLLGRTIEVNIGNHAIRFLNLKFPEDIREGLRELERIEV